MVWSSLHSSHSFINPLPFLSCVGKNLSLIFFFFSRTFLLFSRRFVNSNTYFFLLFSLPFFSTSGLSRRAFWRVIPLEKLPIDSIVIQEPVLIGSKSNLRSYVFEKMNEPMNEDSHQNFPLWNITLVRTSFNNQVILIIRVHQSVCDGIGLLSTLIEQLADQAPPSTTTFIRTCQGTMTATNCE